MSRKKENKNEKKRMKKMKIKGKLSRNCFHCGKKGHHSDHCYILKNKEKCNKKAEKVVEEEDDLVPCSLTAEIEIKEKESKK